MTPVVKLQGLGQKSAEMLAAIGVNSKEELEQLGPITAYLKIREETSFNPSLNLLYAMAGALSGTDWRKVAREERFSLLMSLDGYENLKEMFDDQLYD